MGDKIANLIKESHELKQARKMEEAQTFPEVINQFEQSKDEVKFKMAEVKQDWASYVDEIEQKKQVFKTDYASGYDGTYEEFYNHKIMSHISWINTQKNKNMLDYLVPLRIDQEADQQMIKEIYEYEKEMKISASKKEIARDIEEQDKLLEKLAEELKRQQHIEKKKREEQEELYILNQQIEKYSHSYEDLYGKEVAEKKKNEVLEESPPKPLSVEDSMYIEKELAIASKYIAQEVIQVEIEQATVQGGPYPTERPKKSLREILPQSKTREVAERLNVFNQLGQQNLSFSKIASFFGGLLALLWLGIQQAGRVLIMPFRVQNLVFRLIYGGVLIVCSGFLIEYLLRILFSVGGFFTALLVSLLYLVGVVIGLIILYLLLHYVYSKYYVQYRVKKLFLENKRYYALKGLEKVYTDKQEKYEQEVKRYHIQLVERFKKKFEEEYISLEELEQMRHKADRKKTILVTTSNGRSTSEIENLIERNKVNKEMISRSLERELSRVAVDYSAEVTLANLDLRTCPSYIAIKEVYNKLEKAAQKQLVVWEAWREKLAEISLKDYDLALIKGEAGEITPYLEPSFFKNFFDSWSKVNNFQQLQQKKKEEINLIDQALNEELKALVGRQEPFEFDEIQCGMYPYTFFENATTKVDIPFQAIVHQRKPQLIVYRQKDLSIAKLGNFVQRYAEALQNQSARVLVKQKVHHIMEKDITPFYSPNVSLEKEDNINYLLESSINQLDKVTLFQPGDTKDIETYFKRFIERNGSNGTGYDRILGKYHIQHIIWPTKAINLSISEGEQLSNEWNSMISGMGARGLLPIFYVNQQDYEESEDEGIQRIKKWEQDGFIHKHEVQLEPLYIQKGGIDDV